MSSKNLQSLIQDEKHESSTDSDENTEDPLN